MIKKKIFTQMVELAKQAGVKNPPAAAAQYVIALNKVFKAPAKSLITAVRSYISEQGEDKIFKMIRSMGADEGFKKARKLNTKSAMSAEERANRTLIMFMIAASEAGIKTIPAKKLHLAIRLIAKASGKKGLSKVWTSIKNIKVPVGDVKLSSRGRYGMTQKHYERFFAGKVKAQPKRKMTAEQKAAAVERLAAARGGSKKNPKGEDYRTVDPNALDEAPPKKREAIPKNKSLVAASEEQAIYTGGKGMPISSLFNEKYKDVPDNILRAIIQSRKEKRKKGKTKWQWLTNVSKDRVVIKRRLSGSKKDWFQVWPRQKDSKIDVSASEDAASVETAGIKEWVSKKFGGKMSDQTLRAMFSKEHGYVVSMVSLPGVPSEVTRGGLSINVKKAKAGYYGQLRKLKGAMIISCPLKKPSKPYEQYASYVLSTLFSAVVRRYSKNPISKSPKHDAVFRKEETEESSVVEAGLPSRNTITPAKAYEHGYAARGRGKKLSDNPHKDSDFVYDRKNARQWNKGWKDNDQKFKDKNKSTASVDPVKVKMSVIARLKRVAEIASQLNEAEARKIASDLKTGRKKMSDIGGYSATSLIMIAKALGIPNVGSGKENMINRGVIKSAIAEKIGHTKHGDKTTGPDPRTKGFDNEARFTRRKKSDPPNGKHDY